MTRTDEPDIICAAAARDQAGVVFEYARSFAESGPLADHLVIGRQARSPWKAFGARSR